MTPPEVTAADREAVCRECGAGSEWPQHHRECARAPAAGGTDLVLSLFPGIGLLDMAFEEQGFCVVRGPDLLWGGDVRRFYPPAGRFDGVIGGPPCQAFSPLRFLVAAQGRTAAPNMITEFERVVAAAAPSWWLSENVPAAPHPTIPGYGCVCLTVKDVHLGGETTRERTFCFGTRGSRTRLDLEYAALHRTDPEPPVLASGGSPDGVNRTARAVATRKGAAVLGFKTEAYYRKALRGQGLPEDFLRGSPFTVAGKIKAVGNGVPLSMGRAIAKSVRLALDK